MTTVPLSEWAETTLDGSGAGTVKLGPRAHGQVWKPRVASIASTGSTPSGVATCSVYAGALVNDATFIDATYDVLRDSTDRVDGQALTPGQYVWAVWSGGNAGATATLTLTGSMEIS